MASCLVMFCACFLAAGDKDVSLKEIGITLPKSLAGLRHQRRETFEGKGLGYSESYSNRMCRVTLYVYDLERKDIPNGKGNKVVEEQLKQAIGDVYRAEKKGLYRNVKRIDAPVLKDARPTFETAGFTFDIQGGGGCKSYILVTGHRKHFVKVRVTQYVVDSKTNDEEVQAFLAELAKRLARDSE